MVESGQTLAQLTAGMAQLPQTLINVRTQQRVSIDDSDEIQTAIADAEHRLADRGRILVRASGTESVVRVMVEGEDEAEVLQLAADLASKIERIAA